MILSANTLKSLQNFATINPNILVTKDSNIIKTVAEAKNIMAMVETDDTFDETFGIFDLNEFLSAVSIIPNPDFTFGSEYVTIKSASSNSSIKYFCANPSILTSPTSDIKDPEYEITLELTNGHINSIKKAASVLGHDRFSFVKEGSNEVYVQVADVNNKSSNVYREAIGEVNDSSSFQFNFLINNLKILPGDYVVDLSSKLISRWELVSAGAPKMTYWLAIETTSEYKKEGE